MSVVLVSKSTELRKEMFVAPLVAWFGSFWPLLVI